MVEGQVALLENLRFHKGETDNDPEFARQLSNLAEVFVNDAFGTAHRAHASTFGVAELLPTRYSGLLIAKELEYLGQKTDSPNRPFTVILGGAKVSDKIKVIDKHHCMWIAQRHTRNSIRFLIDCNCFISRDFK